VGLYRPGGTWQSPLHVLPQNMDGEYDPESATSVLVFDESVEQETNAFSKCANVLCGVLFNAKTYNVNLFGRFKIKYTLSVRLVFSILGFMVRRPQHRTFVYYSNPFVRFIQGYILFGPLFGPPAGIGFSITPLILAIFVLLIHINDWRQQILPWMLRIFGVIWALIPLTFYYFPAPGRWEPYVKQLQ
jgi:hypothetical protein